MRVLLFFLSRGSFLCAFVLFLLLLDVEIPVVLAEKKPVVPAETIAKWHRHHKLFKEKRLLVRREGEAQSVSAEEKEEKSGWEDRWEHRVKVVEKNNNDDKNNDAIAGKATSPNVAAGKEESDLALELFRKIPRKKREEILRALENFKKEKEAEEKEEGAGNRKEERNEEETRRKLELLEKERKEKERKLAVVVAREASVAEAAPSTGEKGDDDGFVPVDESALAAGTVAYGTYDTCDTCEMCSVEEPPKGVDTGKAAKAKETASGTTRDGKIHCKKCFGCNVVLSRLESNQNLHGKKVKMFAGASGAAVVRGYTKEHGNVIIKSWCDFGGYKQHPETAAKHPLTCNEETQSKNTQCPIKGGIHAYGECNYKFLNALDKLTVDSNLTGVVPRTWTGSVKTFLPWDGHAVQGHKIDVRSQFYEVAKGYSIEAVYGSSVAQDTVEMFKNIKHEEVIKAATFDLLFSEQDRHGQNVFVTEEGDVTLIDSEGCFGPTNSLLLPGGQKFEVYRIGYNAVCCGNTPLSCPQPAGERTAPIVAMDYRCHAKDHFVGFDWPKGVEPFLRKIQKMTEDDVHEVYEMTRKEHATHLKRTVDELLELGFEGALLKAYQRQNRGDGLTYGNNYWYPITRACCGNDICPMRVDDAVGRVNIEKSTQGELAEKLWGDKYVHGLDVKNSPSATLLALSSLNVPKPETSADALVDRLKQQEQQQQTTRKTH